MTSSHEPGLADTRAHWDRFYGERERRWSGRANPVLVEVAAALPPRRALDLGCGEGSDAVWLAERGWSVTAVDVSATALRRAGARAAATGLGDRIDWQQHDLAVTFPDGAFELVSAQYLHSPLAFPRAAVLRAAAGAVAPGGLLLVVGHAAAPPWAEHAGHDHQFDSPDEVLRLLELPTGQWRTDRAEVSAREAAGPDGRTGTLLDSVVALTRRTQADA